jgi:non-specific serine/threonine protein kinase
MEGTAAMRRTNLPAEQSSFVGRRHELAQVRSGLAERRLVTLVGPGGVGKTRLAFRAAADLARRYRDGAWVVELAPVADPDLVPDTVVAALGLRETSGRPVDRLVAHLAGRELLLVLDNCEHVQADARRLAADLLDACPGLHVVATSRHALGVPGERLLDVPPLTVPDPDRDGSPEGLMHYDAVRLFVDRATASWSAFEVTDANQAALAELVRRLDGVPLALELAAVRVRTLSVQQILDRLEDRFALLSRGSRPAMPRQQSLRALIKWSHDLLDQRERLLWARASVFVGSFDLVALTAVATDPDLPPDDIPRLAEALAAKSLLVAEPGDGRGPRRFHLLESIREFGAARLAAADDTEARVRRHREHYATLAHTAARQMYGPDEVAWFRRLRADHDNLRTALERLLHDAAGPARGLRMVGALQHYFVMAGRFGEARLWLRRLLALPASGVELAAGLEVAGRLAVLQGDVDEGRALLERALAEATDAGSPTWRAHALHGLALAKVFWAEPAEAVPLLEEALDLHGDGDDPFGVPLALVQLATVHATLDQPGRAMKYAEECIRLSHEHGDQWCAGLARWTQALVVWREGRTSRVRYYARQVLRLKEPFGDRLGMAMSMEVVAWAEAAAGRHERAAVLLGAVETALASIGGSLFRHLLDDHDRCVAEVRAALGAAAYDDAARRGGALEFDEAVTLALGRRSRAGGSEAPLDRSREVRLTRRENEVAALVADGLTNREIAERMVTSQRTAEGHVARILRKLGFTSREQLTAWVREHRTAV